jgi:hypothetical protein
LTRDERGEPRLDYLPVTIIDTPPLDEIKY